MRRCAQAKGAFQRGLLGVFVLALAASVPVRGQEQDRFAVSAGVFNFNKSRVTGVVALEYRLRPLKYGLIPAVGAAVESDGAHWAWVGVRYDIGLSPQWRFTPQVAVAGYEEGGGKDLGGFFEFRVAGEVSRRIGRRSRLGLTLGHLSSGGLHEKNPGVNTLLVTYSF